MRCGGRLGGLEDRSLSDEGVIRVRVVDWASRCVVIRMTKGNLYAAVLADLQIQVRHHANLN